MQAPDPIQPQHAAAPEQTSVPPEIELLARAHPLTLVVEFAPESLRAGGFEPTELLRTLRASGFEVSLVNIIDEQDGELFRYVFGAMAGNPLGDHVHNCVLSSALHTPHPELADLIARLHRPDAIS